MVRGAAIKFFQRTHLPLTTFLVQLSDKLNPIVEQNITQGREEEQNHDQRGHCKGGQRGAPERG
jgi:hypothetical protein